MQSALVALILFLLWQPALMVAELNSQQNIIAVVVDDSRSMSIADTNGGTREAAAIVALQSERPRRPSKAFPDAHLPARQSGHAADGVERISPTEAATHISDGLKQLVAETADLPVGAILLLSDGGENAASASGSGISPAVLEALRNRRLPVHTVGFGREELAHDVEIEDVSLAANAAANARIAATVTLTEQGYAGQKAQLTVRDGHKALAEREITLAAGWTDPDRASVLSGRRRWREESRVQRGTVARRRKPRQQCRHAAHSRQRCEASHSVYRR